MSQYTRFPAASGGGSSGTVDQGSQGSPFSPWFVTDQSALAQLMQIVTELSGTLTISGMVTANAGTNLNTSALALESGGHLASIDAKLSTINTTLGSPFQAGGSIGNTSFGISGTLPAYASTPTFNIGTTGGIALDSTLSSLSAKFGSLGQKLMTGSAPVVIASDQSAIPVTGTFFQATQPVSGTVTANAGTNLNTSALNLEATQSAFKTANHTDLGLINTTLGSPMQNSGGSVTANAGTNLNTSALALQSGANSALDKTASGSISALNGTVAIATNGISTAYVSTTGTWVGTLAFEGMDGSGNWSGTFGRIPFSTLIGDFVGNGAAAFAVGGFVQFRVKAVAWTSGTASIAINASVGLQAIEVFNLTPGNLQVVANAGTNLNTSALALDTSVSGLQVSQGSTTSGQKGTLSQGAVTTNAPSYTDGQTSPISLTTRGATRSIVVGGDTSLLIRNDYSTTNVTTAAYVQLTASTTININRLLIFDSSGQDFVLATGGAGSEVDQIQISPGGWNCPVDLFIPSGSRLSIKSKSATASSGILLITGLK